MSFFPPNYGYVFAALGFSFVMNGYLTFNVIQARSKYGIQYPDLYAPIGHKYQFEFNSVQRAHQNTLESYAIVMLKMCICGLIYPITSASFGAIWILGRIIYGYGYAQGGPKGRTIGFVLSLMGYAPLTATCFKIAYDLILKK